MKNSERTVYITAHAFGRIRERMPFFSNTDDADLRRLVEASLPSAVSLAPTLHGRHLIAVKLLPSHTAYLIVKTREAAVEVITCFTAAMADNRLQEFTRYRNNNNQRYGKWTKGNRGPKPPRNLRRGLRRDQQTVDDDDDEED